MMEPDTHADTPWGSLSPASNEDGSEARANVHSPLDLLDVSRICHVQTAKNRVRLL